MTPLLLLAALQGDPFDTDPRLFPVRVIFDQSHAKPGQTLWMAVEFEIPPAYHIYDARPFKKDEFETRPTTVEPDAEGGLSFGGARWPDAHFAAGGPSDGLPIYEGTIYAAFEVTVPPSTAPGEYRVTVSTSYLICDENVCLRPVDDRKIEASIKVSGEAPAMIHEEIFGSLRTRGVTATDLATARYEGLLPLMGLGVVGGLVSLLMPCVWPLIPVTLLYFVKQGGDSRARSFGLAATYGIGIILSFTGIGLAFTLALGSDGARIFAQNPWVNIAVGAIFMVFGISMFGVFEITLPGALTNRVAGGGPRGGFFGAFLLGLLFSIVTFTCTVPVSATILALATSAQHRMASAIAMIVYSATMAAPFLLMGLFPALIKRVPRSGGWMNTVKVTVAFVEVGLALFYFAKSDAAWQIGALSRTTMIVIWVVVLAATGLYLFGAFGRLVKSWAAPITLSRIAWAMVFLSLAGVMGTVLAGHQYGITSVVLPPAAPKHPNSLDVVLADAKESGRLVFVEFTGVT